MNRKIIIKTDDLNREIYLFLNEVGTDMPLEWTFEAIDPVRHAVVEAFEKMGVTLEIDEGYRAHSYSEQRDHWKI